MLLKIKIYKNIYYDNFLCIFVKNYLGVFLYHYKDMEDKVKTQKNAQKYICDYCDFKCSKQSDWTRHIFRPKHIFNEKRYKTGNILSEKTPHDGFICDCGKLYQYSSGLWRHKQICQSTKKTPDIELINTNMSIQQITPELVIKLIEQNKELQQTLIDQNKTIMDLAVKAGTNNSYNNNKTFNLQIFLHLFTFQSPILVRDKIIIFLIA